jgi:hypothetical protein
MKFINAVKLDRKSGGVGHPSTLVRTVWSVVRIVVCG